MWDRELNRALLLNGTFLRKRQLVQLLRQYDEDGTGTLDFEVSELAVVASACYAMLCCAVRVYRLDRPLSSYWCLCICPVRVYMPVCLYYTFGGAVVASSPSDHKVLLLAMYLRYSLS